jgi:hypothetical protein
MPEHEAGNATEVEIDFSERGGMLMIRRRILPSRTCSRCHAMALMCQLS